MLVVKRIRVHLDDHLPSVGTALYRERLTTHALAAQCPRCRMLVHEQARPIDRARAVELPELTQGRGLSCRMIVQRLCIRPYGASLCIDDAHGVGNDVEDRLELRDAARQVFT